MTQAADTKRRPKRWHYVVLGCTVCMFAFVAIGARTLNNRATQQRLLDYINERTTWTIQTSGWHWDLVTSELTLRNLKLKHNTSGHTIQSKHFHVSYDPWALLWATLKVDRLELSDTQLQLHDMPPPSKQRRVSLSRLLLLRNIEIGEAIITNLHATLPNDTTLGFRQATVQYTPRWFRDVKVHSDIAEGFVDNAKLSRASAQRLTIEGATSIHKWINRAPYINDIEGTVVLQHGLWREAPLEFAALNAHLQDGHISIDKLDAITNGKEFRGQGMVNLDSRESALRIEWIDPMPIPELMHDESFMLTAGDVQGYIDWQGEGFTLAELNGTISTDLTHTAQDIAEHPAHIRAQGQVNKGVITVPNAQLTVSTGQAQASATIDLPQKHTDVRFTGTELPIAGVLRRFRNENFHPAQGLASCEGHFQGWKGKYTFDLTANTVGRATYYDIEIDKLDLSLHQTYPELTLQAKLWQGQRQTGSADMTMRFGKAPEGKRSRTANIDLTASINNHDLADSFAIAALTGTGKANVKVVGPTTNYRGTVELEIDEGSFQGVPLEKLRSTVALAPKKLTLAPTTIKLANVPLWQWPGTLVMDIDQGMRLRGTPQPGLDLDLAYDSNSALWTYHQIRYDDPELRGAPLVITGSGRTGDWSIRAQGTANARWLQSSPEYFREAGGPLTLDLTLQGDMALPQIHGHIDLAHNWLMFRGWPQEWNELEGRLRFAGQRIQFENFRGLVGDGPTTVTGWAEHEGLTIPRFDLHLLGRSLYHVTDDRHFRMEFDADTKITQLDGEHMDIVGSLRIVDALYDKDFRVLDHATQSVAKIEREKFRAMQAGYDKIRLDLNTTSQGDVQIRNNVADIVLRTNVHVGGTVAEPTLTGDFETTDGEIHYLGLSFDIVNGSMNFDAGANEPFIDFQGEKNVGDHLVQLNMRGPADNMQIDLQSVPGEDRRDILCLIAYGASCDLLRTSQFGAKIGPGILVEQVGKLLEKPIEKLTGFDVVRVESAIGTSDLSSLHIGKRFSDRLEMGFVTTVGGQDSEQSIEASYQLSDAFLLKAQTGSNTGVKMSVRLRER